jgi:SHS2 domain-containing protein
VAVSLGGSTSPSTDSPEGNGGWNCGAHRMYEYFGHTADVGIRVQAAGLAQLFEDAARALFGLMVENLEEVQPRERVPVHLPPQREVEYLLFDWLSELIYLFDTRRMVLSRFNVRLSDAGLEAEAAGEPLDAARHRLRNEIKAITYHELSVRPTAEGWEATVIVDI